MTRIVSATVLSLLFASVAAAQSSGGAGRQLYLDYGCYSCHGYNAQTGNGQRLLPPRLQQPQFIAYIRNPRTRGMPAYSQKVLSDGQVADIYNYIVSLPAAPEFKDIALLTQLSTAVAAPQDDPFNGTWQLNVSKSTMQPATSSRSEIIHYRIVGNEEQFVSEAVTGKGEAESIKYNARDDGKPYPFLITIDGKPTTAPDAMTMVKRIDALTRERYNIRGGRPIIASRRVVSRDGKTMTITIIRVDASGKEVVNETRLLEKQ
jgi:mono/diheme cytochrome c family protein